MFGLSLEFSQKLIDILLSKGGNFADIYAEEEELFSFVVENNKVKAIKTGIDKGLHLRVLKGNKTFSAYTNNTSELGLQSLAQNIAHSLNDIQTQRSQVAVLSDVAMNSLQLDYYKDTLENFITQSKKIYQQSPKIGQATLSYYNAHKSVWVINSNGEACQDNRIYNRYTVNVVAKDGDITQTSFEGPGITGKENIFLLHPLQEASDNVVARALLMLKAKPAPTGKMPVILLGEAGGTMIHEACGHALEADFIYKDTSIFKDKIGTRVAAECVTVVDDGSIPHQYGSYQFDDEGVAPRRNVLIEKGILKNYITDRMNADLLGIPLSGNGRRESYQSKPVPRMSNTFIEDTHMDSARVIDSVAQGILVKRMGGGQVNITNGEFIFEISEGYLIEKGKITTPIRGASMIGNGPQVLQDIAMVANDKKFIAGVCGKYDHVPVGDAQPTLMIKELTIGGM